MSIEIVEEYRAIAIQAKREAELYKNLLIGFVWDWEAGSAFIDKSTLENEVPKMKMRIQEEGTLIKLEVTEDASVPSESD